MGLFNRDPEVRIARDAYREANATQQAHARQQSKNGSHDEGATYLGLNENTDRTRRDYKAIKASRRNG